MPITCLAIDDEPLALQKVSKYIEQVPYLTLRASCQSALEAKQVLDNESIDAVFIDINMPDLNGLDFVRALAAPPMVVFTTAYSEYAVEGFKVDAVDYLLKPFGFDDFQRAAAKLKSRYDARQAAEVSRVDEDDAIFVKTDYKVVRLNVASITYVEAMSEYLRIYTDESSRPLIVLLSMKKMEERLPAAFMRVHRSYIINLRRIEEVGKSRVHLKGGVEIPVGDLYKEKFNNYIASKFLSK